MGILEVTGEAELQQILDNDPVIKAGMGAHYAWYPIPRGVIHRNR